MKGRLWGSAANRPARTTSRLIELFGVGLSSAVLLDALVVRSVLVPAVMLMLGDRNWQLPAVLERLLPHFRVEGRRAEAAYP